MMFIKIPVKGWGEERHVFNLLINLTTSRSNDMSMHQNKSWSYWSCFTDFLPFVLDLKGSYHSLSSTCTWNLLVLFKYIYYYNYY